MAPLETAPAVKRAAQSGVKPHFPDGRAWDGAGEWGYVREALDL
ncbi:MAG: hypothetical protein AB1408_04120 [Pseudomonadota bacterium]